MAFTSGELEEIESIVYTDFVVMIRNKEDLLNTANLVILKSKTQIKDKEDPLNSFDIFNETTVKEFEENPNGSKYPMAEFHFYDNGTIENIYLPNEMSKEEAQNMIDLINNVIPKLSRNKTDDDKKGIIISSKNLSKKKSFKEYENPKEFTDKYSNCTFKGSKLTKDVEREVEDEKISEIRANTNLFLETQEEPENKNYIDLGIKNFYYNSSSKIILTQIKKDKKEDINLIKRLCSKLSLIESEELIQSIVNREIEEQRNLKQNLSKSDTDISENKIRNRILKFKDNLESSFGFTWEIIQTNILGQETTIGYYVDPSIDGKISHGLLINFGWSTFKIENVFINLNKNSQKRKVRKNDLPLAKIPLGCLPVFLSLKLGGSFDTSATGSIETFKLDFTGSLFIKAGVEFGIEHVATIEAGVKGDFISVNFSTSFKKNLALSHYHINKYSKDKISLNASSCTVSAYANAKVWIWTIFSAEFEVMKGFKIAEITW